MRRQSFGARPGTCIGASKTSAVSNLQRLVDDYIGSLRNDRQRELGFYRDARTDEEAVSAAALAQLESGKRHPHQYRIPLKSLTESRRRLVDHVPAIRDCTSFEELIDLVNGLVRSIDRVGALVVYDTALRIGVRFGLEPEKVYLHRGAREGARKLGFDASRATLDMNELPSAIRKLTPRETEDFLCVYKDSFSTQTVVGRLRDGAPRLRCRS
jgi:hypothetical protein